MTRGGGTARAGTTLARAGWLIDGTGAESQRDMALTIEGGLIARRPYSSVSMFVAVGAVVMCPPMGEMVAVIRN